LEPNAERARLIHTISYDVLSTTTRLFVFRKTKKLHCIWFPAEPSVANHPAAERRAGGKGAAVCAAA